MVEIKCPGLCGRRRLVREASGLLREACNIRAEPSGALAMGAVLASAIGSESDRLWVIGWEATYRPLMIHRIKGTPLVVKRCALPAWRSGRRVPAALPVPGGWWAGTS